MIQKSFLIMAFLLVLSTMNAQDLFSPSYGFSHSKTAGRWHRNQWHDQGHRQGERANRVY